MNHKIYLYLLNREENKIKNIIIIVLFFIINVLFCDHVFLVSDKVSNYKIIITNKSEFKYFKSDYDYCCIQFHIMICYTHFDI